MKSYCNVSRSHRIYKRLEVCMGMSLLYSYVKTKTKDKLWRSSFYFIFTLFLALKMKIVFENVEVYVKNKRHVCKNEDFLLNLVLQCSYYIALSMHTRFFATKV